MASFRGAISTTQKHGRAAEFEFEVPDEELAGTSQEQYDETVRFYAVEAMWNWVEMSWEEIEEDD